MLYYNITLSQSRNMQIRLPIAFTLIVLIVLAQGIILLHKVDHMLPVDNGDCALCLKAEQQKHTLVAAGVIFGTTLVFFGQTAISFSRLQAANQ